MPSLYCQSGSWQPVGGSNNIKAAVNFDGDSCGATCPIRSSLNILSVQRISAGVYRVNFATALPSSSYSTFTSYTNGASNYSGYMGASYSETTSSVIVQSFLSSGAFADRNGISVFVVY